MCIVCDGKTSDILVTNGGRSSVGRASGWQPEGSWVRDPSAPPSSLQDLELLGFTLGGFVAGEGSFMARQVGICVADGSPLLRFWFAVQVASRDRALLETLQGFLGVGEICDKVPRQEHFQPISAFEVRSRRFHKEAIIPFADRFLLPCAKRRQFETWPNLLEEYEGAHPYPRGRSICSEPSCGRHVRGRGLCRSHYYQATGY